MGKSHLTAGFIPMKASCDLWHFHIQYMKEYHRNVPFYLETTTITNHMEKLRIRADWDVFIRDYEPTAKCRVSNESNKKKSGINAIQLSSYLI